jgi:two-component system chemotaxis response regulator CheB
LTSPEHINLGIGEIFIGEAPSIISTILGSCVSVTVFCPRKNLGGIIHFALPDRSYATNSHRSDLNFGDSAIEILVARVLEIPGVQKGDLVAKIVGGGNVVNELSKSTLIGDLNIETARTTLKRLGLRITGENVGGGCGRKVYFYTHSGRLRVSKIGSEPAEKIMLKPLGKKVRVLIVDDSKTVRDILTKILSSDQIEVVGKAANSLEAEKLIERLRPDVITLDIHMPGMDGVTFLEHYLPKFPIPTVMISSISMVESDLILRALERGAVDYLQKPSLPEIASKGELIREKIITTAAVDLGKSKTSERGMKATYTGLNRNNKIVAIGASTGGTEALKKVLLMLPPNIPPILIVQHIPPIFSTAFAKRLNELCPFEVIEGKDGDEVLPGRVIIAPGGKQMELILEQNKKKVRVFEGELVNRHRPSVDVLFHSVARLLGKNSLGVILTGMGNDGAAGLLEMRKSGAHTIGQDEASSVVYGMPKAADQLKAVAQVCSIEEVPFQIIRNLEKN